jgi:transcription elongation factor Elf1
VVLTTIIRNHIRSRAGGFDFIRCNFCGKDNRIELEIKENESAFFCQSCDIPIEEKDFTLQSGIYSDILNDYPDIRPL